MKSRKSTNRSISISRTIIKISLPTISTLSSL